MKRTTILFDLDGTLLPLEQKTFTKECFDLMHKKLSPFGYDMDVLYNCMNAMISNDGTKTNEQALMDKVFEIRGEKANIEKHLFDEFYATDFNLVRKVCGYDKKANETIKKLKEKGYKLAIATNPLFPRIATEKRIAWAGLDINDFELVSTYEDFHFCKPDERFYEEFVIKLGVDAHECLMVGNDAVEDMVAERIGMKVFLLTDCLILDKKTNIDNYPKGDFDELLDFIEKIS